MMTKKKRCAFCGKEKLWNKYNFYWDSGNSKFENRCKACRLQKQKYQKRVDYDPKAERERYLRRKATGEFKDVWKKWKARYPEKYKARYLLTNAVRQGKITKLPCEVCGEAKVEAHHEDYSKPYEVRWLCRKHHKMAHYGTAEELLTTLTPTNSEEV